MNEWVRSEPGFARLGQEIRRLTTRFRSPRHWRRALLLAIVFTALVLGFEIRKPHRYYASIVMTMTEGRVQERTGPVPKKELRTYISDVSLNRRHVLKLLDDLNLYPGLRAIDPTLALNEFWSDVEIEVYQNQFANERDQQARRSARVSITYAATEPETAVMVVNELRRIMSDFEVRRARRAAEEATAEITDGIHAAEDILDQHKARLQAKSDALLIAPPQKAPSLEYEVQRLKDRILEDTRRIDQLQKARAAHDVRSKLDIARSDQFLQIVDSRVPAPHDPSLLRLALIGLTLFMVSFPLAGMAVAAFDSRLYDANDIRRLGVEVVGWVPPFHGADVGSLSARRRS